MKVSSTIRELVHKIARQVCASLKIEVSKFNQDACAATCLLALEHAKTPEERLQVCHVCSNSSALKQALESPAKQKSAAVAADLVKMVTK